MIMEKRYITAVPSWNFTPSFSILFLKYFREQMNRLACIGHFYAFLEEFAGNTMNQLCSSPYRRAFANGIEGT